MFQFYKGWSIQGRVQYHAVALYLTLRLHSPKAGEGDPTLGLPVRTAAYQVECNFLNRSPNLIHIS